MPDIFIISDGTGRTALQILEAALTQFEQIKPNIKVRAKLRSKRQVIDIIAEAQKANGFVVHTVVSRTLREFILHQGRLHNVETIDLMGPLLARLSDKFSNTPSEEPGLFYQLNKAYFQRIEAMEFAFRHDDGRRVHEIDKAEIVLVGVSRTFKTPISMYLAFKGWLVANVPVIMGQNIPSVLEKSEKCHVFGLVTDPRNLVKIRQSRHTHLGGVTKDYIDFETVNLELMHARRIFSKHPEWSIIKVTNKPIEEIAFEILEILRNHQIKHYDSY